MTRDAAEARTFDRRDFVKLAGAGAGIAVAGPLVLAGSGRASNTIQLKVGVITATGSNYSKMGRSLIDGLALGFAHRSKGTLPLQATLVTRTVERGYGGVETAAGELLDQGAEVVVAGISALVAERLGRLFTERKSSLVVANVGAHVVAPGARNEYVVHNSLLYWQASYAAGRWAATHMGKRAFITSSLADSGYDTIYAFRRGFESAGGAIVGDAVTHVDPAQPGLAALFAEVRGSGADVLYGVYSGHRAAQFVQAYAKSGVGAKLVAGSLAVEDYQLSAIGSAALGATSCASWTGTRSTGANRAFGKAFDARFGRAPDPFAALGYDTASLVAKGARLSTTGDLAIQQLALALAGASTAGARGPLTVDPATNTVVGPLWMRQVKRNGGGLANVDIANAQSVGPLPPVLEPLTHGTVAGYVNEYLCA